MCPGGLAARVLVEGLAQTDDRAERHFLEIKSGHCVAEPAPDTKSEVDGMVTPRLKTRAWSRVPSRVDAAPPPSCRGSRSGNTM